SMSTISSSMAFRAGFHGLIVSYGTDLALTDMREHSEGVRSVTIDSVPPPLAGVAVNGTTQRQGLDNILISVSPSISPVSSPPRLAARNCGSSNRKGSRKPVCRLHPRLLAGSAHSGR